MISICTVHRCYLVNCLPCDGTTVTVSSAPRPVLIFSVRQRQVGLLFESRHRKKWLVTKCMYKHIQTFDSQPKGSNTSSYILSHIVQIRDIRRDIGDKHSLPQPKWHTNTVAPASSSSCELCLCDTWVLCVLFISTPQTTTTQTQSCDRWLIPQSHLCMFSCLR